MNKKQKVRENFRNAVFKRDGNKCRVCGKRGTLDAHHITNRNEMPNGGYVLENGISLCDGVGNCHFKAEDVYFGREKDEAVVEKYNPDALYKLIGSSKELAIEKSEEL